MADENTIKRIPPHDMNAERSVIGSMLILEINSERRVLLRIYAVLVFWVKYWQMYLQQLLQRIMPA